MTDFLHCVSCQRLLTDSAKYLGCLHTCCMECLHTIEQDNCIRCTKCTSITCLGEFGVEGLPNNSIGMFAGIINAKTNSSEEKKYCRVCKLNSNPPTLYCFACDYYLCQKCQTDSHQLFQKGHGKYICLISEFEKNDLQTLIRKFTGNVEESVKCCIHPHEKASLYCENEGLFLCGAHNSSSLISIPDLIGKRGATIRNEMEKSTIIIEEMKKRHNSLESLYQNFESDCSESIAEVNQYFDSIISAANQRRDDIIAEIIMKNNIPKENLADEVEKQDNSLEKYYDSQKFISWYYKLFPECLVINDYEAIRWYLTHVKESKTANVHTLHKFAGILSPCEFISDNKIIEKIKVCGVVKQPVGSQITDNERKSSGRFIYNFYNRSVK